MKRDSTAGKGGGGRERERERHEREGWYWVNERQRARGRAERLNIPDVVMIACLLACLVFWILCFFGWWFFLSFKSSFCKLVRSERKARRGEAIAIAIAIAMPLFYILLFFFFLFFLKKKT